MMTEQEEFEFRFRLERERGSAKPASDGFEFPRWLGGQVRNAAAGAVRGAGSIGATLLSPRDALESYIARKMGAPELQVGDRRQAMTGALSEMGADPSSVAFGVGKLGAEVAGTAGVGGAIAKPVGAVLGRAAPSIAPAVTEAVRTAGMSTGGVGGVGGMAARMAGGAITGGASAGLVDPQEAAMGAAIGGAAPAAFKVAGAAGDLIGKGARAMVGRASDDVATLARRAQELGIDIPADRLVNSKPLDAISSALNYVPFSGRAGTEAKMTSQLNRALSRTFGEDSSNVTMALRKANLKLGGEFERVLSSNGIRVDPQFMDDVAGVYNKAQSELGADALKPIASKVDDLMQKAQSGVIDGKAAYNIKRDLDRIGGGNTTTAWHAIELKKKLMEALDRSLGPDAAAKFKSTRQMYGNMLDLEKLAKNGVEGEVSVARIANMKDIGNKPLQEIADIAAQFVKQREGQHGAMQRAVVGLTGASVGGLPALAAGAVAGRSTNAILNSQSMRNMMLGDAVPNPLIELLQKPEAQQLIYRAAPVSLAPSR